MLRHIKILACVVIAFIFSSFSTSSCENPPSLPIITAIFLVVGIVFSFFYPKDNRIYLLATVLIISAVLFYCCINPMPSEWIYDKIIFLNGGSGWI